MFSATFWSPGLRACSPVSRVAVIQRKAEIVGA
jgi:hypothetical protein